MQLKTTQLNTLDQAVENIYIEELGSTADMTPDDFDAIMALDDAQRKRVMDALRIDTDALDVEGDKHCDNPDCERRQTITGHILLQSELIELCLYCQGLTNEDTYGYSRLLMPLAGGA